MSQALIDELRKENLCTHFILPLIKLNKHHFVSSNFVNCFLTADGSAIIVQVVEVMLLSRSLYNHEDYNGTYCNENGDIFFVYRLPVVWRSDIERFMKGKFSMMSKRAKENIIRYSGLLHESKEKGSNRTITDGRLLALEKHPKMRDMWEVQLNDRDIPDELLSIPGEESYLEISSLIKAQL